MVNNKIMKKILFIISLCVILLTSCQTQMQNVVEVSEKTIKLTEEITINYPSINDFVDNEFLTSVESTYNYIINNYDTIPEFSYQYYKNENYVSYLVNYKYLDKTLIKTYNYNLKSNKQVYFNISKVINKINRAPNFKYHLTNVDGGFLNVLVNHQNLEIYLSKYLTNSKVEVFSFPFDEEYLTDEKFEIFPRGYKKIALTFDDGPSSKTTEIVDLLSELEIKATFFVLGSNVKYYKNELRYIYEHGHEIGNHSYTHPNFKKISINEGLEEIEKTQNAIYEVIKHYPRIFRFPYGAINKEILKNINLPTVLWSADSLDWKRGDSSTIIKRVEKEAHENGILLFHDFKYYNYNAIKTVVNDLKNKGYAFVTLSELLDFASDETIKMGKVYYYKSN